MACRFHILLASIILVLGLHASAQPMITSFSPAKGPAGRTITITGSNFNATPASNFVYFGPVRGAVINGTSTSLIVNVPGGVSSQPVSVLDITTKLTGFANRPFVMTFNGNPTFNATSFSTEISFKAGFSAIAVADINLDQKPDILALDVNGFSVLQNKSTTGNPAFTTLTFPAGTTSSLMDIAAADFDGDGRKDVAVTSAFQVTVFRNETPGAGTVAFGAKSLFTSDHSYINAIATADFDRDGKIDIVVTNKSSGTISVFRNTTTTGISFAPKVDFPVGSEVKELAIGDLDEDGKADIVACNSGSGSISILKNTTTGNTITFAAKNDLLMGGSPESVALGDLDDDGKLDIAITNSATGDISVSRNNSSPGTIAFTSKVDLPAYISPSGASTFGIDIADLNGDGKLDIAATNHPLHLSVFANNSSSGTISFHGRQDYGTFGSPKPLILVDVDLDGRLDIVAGSAPGGVGVFMNNVSNPCPGTAPLTLKISVNSPVICPAITPVFSVSATTTAQPLLFQWKINGTNSGPLTASTTFSPSGLVVGDKVSCEVSLNNSCGFADQTISNIISMTDVPQGGPSIEIMGGFGSICAGTEAKFTLLVTNAGSVPLFQWMVNGKAVSGAISATFTTTQLKNDDKISCEVTSNEQCQKITKAISNESTVKVLPVVAPKISIAADLSSIYEGSTVTFSAAIENGGTNPGFDWQINGKSVASGKPSFTTKDLKDGDQVMCIVSGPGICTGAIFVPSNVIIISISPVINIKPPTVFTPNGDAINDTWELPGISAFPGNLVQIFNQYGVKVFNSRGYKTPWNGEFKGTALPVGVYYYVVRLDEKTAVSGNVTILR